MNLLDELLSRVGNLSPGEQLAAIKEVEAMTERMAFVPNPGPQTDAYLSQADVMLYGGSAGGGKLLSLDTPIPTPRGWSTMGALRVGDEVFDERGQICNVVAKSNVERETTYRLTFSDGSQVVAGARHQWVTSDYRERMRAWGCSEERRAARRATRPSRGTGKRPDLAERNSKTAKGLDLPLSGIRTTGEIAASVTVDGNRLNHSVAVCGALQLPPAQLLIEPYVLGAWLGDGTTSCGDITGVDEEVFEQVANGGYVVSNRANPITRGILGLKVQLRALGVLGNKHVPTEYLRASVDQRLALLQGLMDTDGYCDQRGQCEFTTISRSLAENVRELLCSLGIKAAVTEGDATLNGRVISRKYRIKFLTELPAFRLPRKLLRQKRAGFRGTHSARYIVACDEVDPVDMQCIQVDSPSHCYLCGEAMIPTHNSFLELGWGINEARNGIIFRRERTQTDGLEKEGKKLIGADARYNGSDLEWNWPDGKSLKLGGIQQPDDWMAYAGRERDYMAFDEGGEFLEMQVASIMAWLRAGTGQRTRVIIGSNPPRTSEGLWMVKWFAPWLDDKFVKPAVPGELRWACGVTRGGQYEIVWVDGPGEYQIDGEPYRAKSYTFIPASLEDNPYRNTPEYRAQLQSLPEPLRSQLLYGKFGTSLKDLENQCIPSEWVRAAQKRWTPEPPRGVPMCSIGVDCAAGGDDNMAVACRHDGWYAPIVKVPGSQIKAERAGAQAAGIVLSYRRDGALVVVDLGGGYGGPLYEHLKANEIECKGFKGAEGTTRRSADAKLKFTNKRSAAYWLFREALDPGKPGGSTIALPDDRRLMAGLTAPTFEVTAQGIKVEPKIKRDEKGRVVGGVMAKLGFSPDEADSVVMAWFEGERWATNATDWLDRVEVNGRKVRAPQVIAGGMKPLSAQSLQPLTARVRR